MQKSGKAMMAVAALAALSCLSFAHDTVVGTAALAPKGTSPGPQNPGPATAPVITA
jgi:hypothetical protein